MMLKIENSKIHAMLTYQPMIKTLQTLTLREFLLKLDLKVIYIQEEQSSQD